VLRRVFEQGAYADRAFASEARSLSPRDRALAMQLAYGTVQRAATIDHIAAQLADRPAQALDPPVLAAVRLGLFQLLLLGGVADHAAVNESVELVKHAGRGGAGLVNAVLRRAAREGSALLAALDDRTAAGAATLHSVPVWLAELWFAQLGAEQARALLAHSNRAPESALRVNTLVAQRDELCTRLPVRVRAAAGLPEGIVLEAPFDPHASPLWRAGAIMPQSRASMLVSRVLAPRPGDRVLDLCAAPGAKTTHLAALMAGEGELVAIERHRGRARMLSQTCARMRAGWVQVRAADASQPVAAGPFGKVLVDPPCSGLGTLQSRPDIRWRASPESIAELSDLQARILAAGAAATAPGGTLVYSVCTISDAESEGVVRRFLGEHSEWSADDLGHAYPCLRQAPGSPYLQLLGHRDRTDGFFVARLRRGLPPTRPVP
jgi:16S rRNA (cytosine967-C5)-methyltransferase